MSLKVESLPPQEKKIWFILINDNAEGPYSYLDLKSQVHQNLLHPKALVWCKGWKTNVPLFEIHHLYRANKAKSYQSQIKASVPPHSNILHAKRFRTELKLALALLVAISTTFWLQELKKPQNIVSGKKENFFTDSVKKSSSAIDRSDAAMTQMTLHALSQEMKSTFYWLNKESFNAQKFKLSQQKYHQNIGHQLLKISMRNDEQFRHFSATLPPEDPQLHLLLKNHLKIKSLGGMSKKMFELVQEKNLLVRKQKIQDWFKEMDTMIYEK